MTIDEMITIASNEIGAKEMPANSNTVKYNDWFYGKRVSGSAYPWCAVFVSWVFKGTNLVKKTASCMNMAQAFKDNNQWHTHPQKGDIVFFKFGTNSRWTNHVGIVVDVSGNYIYTIEGNTSADDKGSQSNGGMVAKRRRTNKNIVGYGRPAYNSGIIAYYPKYNGTSIRIDEIFNAIGVSNEYIGGWQKRKPIALKNGIVDYSGTSAQNTILCNLAKQGKLKRV